MRGLAAVACGFVLACPLALGCDSGEPGVPGKPERLGAASPTEVAPVASTRIVLIADAPSHGPGEHEYRAGTILLGAMLGESPNVSVTLLPTFPADPTVLRDAKTIVFYTNGGLAHPLAQPSSSEAMARELARGVGLVCLHWSTEVPEELGERMVGWLGGAAIRPRSVFPIWEARFPSLPDHPITAGVVPLLEARDEWYFGLRFADRGVVPILRAVPPDALRTTPDTAATPGRSETVAWAYERADGGRSFGYTGGHFHTSWGSADLRRVVTNAILWTARRDIAPGGAPVPLAPERLRENLDPKP